MKLRTLKRIAMAGATLAVTAGLLFGCSSSCANVNMPQGKVQYAPTDKSVTTRNGRVTVSQMKSSKVNGFLKADVVLTSTASRNVPLRYKFTWLDKDGSPVGDDTPWQLAEAYSNGNAYLTSQSTVTTATTYDVRICNR